MAGYVQSTAELGWDGAPGERQIRFELDQPPVVDGRYQFGVALSDASGEHSGEWASWRPAA
jgi:hypothetical protein